MFRFGLTVATIYAIWGNSNLAKLMRGLAFQFGMLLIEFMFCFWLWTFNPLVMSFAIPAVYITYVFGMAEFERQKALKELNTKQAAFIKHIDAELAKNGD